MKEIKDSWKSPGRFSNLKGVGRQWVGKEKLKSCTAWI